MNFKAARSLALIFPLVTLCSSVSWAETKPSPDQKSENSAAEKKVCRRQASTGSIMPAKRICKSKTDWEVIDKNNQNGLERSRAPGTAPAGTPQT